MGNLRAETELQATDFWSIYTFHSEHLGEVSHQALERGGLHMVQKMSDMQQKLMIQELYVLVLLPLLNPTAEAIPFLPLTKYKALVSQKQK